MKDVIKRWSLVIGLTVLLDQATKVAIKLTLPLGYEYRLWGDWLKFHFVENPGAAFGLSLAGLFPGESSMGFWPRLMLTLLALGITIGIGYYLGRWTLREPKILVPAGLILGGAVGNLIDRIFYGVLFASRNAYEGGWFQGHVVDFIYIDLWQSYVPTWVPIWGGEYMALWPIFNIADSAISIGIVWLMLLSFQKPSSE